MSARIAGEMCDSGKRRNPGKEPSSQKNVELKEISQEPQKGTTIMSDAALWTPGNQPTQNPPGAEILAFRQTPTTNRSPLASDNCIRSHRSPGSGDRNKQKKKKQAEDRIATQVSSGYIDSSRCNNEKFRSSQALLGISFDRRKPNVGKFTTWARGQEVKTLLQ